MTIRSFALVLLLLPWSAGCGTTAPRTEAEAPTRHELVDTDRVDPAALTTADERGITGLVLQLGERPVTEEDRAAAIRIRAAGLELGYWFEVGRSELVADAHPDLMASLQGHDEWRASFPETPVPADGEVVKTWPWVPIAYPEAFELHLARIAASLALLPPADVVYLNDLQGPPSSCGCGNTLCRWATDYTMGGKEPLRSAEPSGPEAAARFVAAVRGLVPASRVVPVWVTECEESDREGPCRGVGCYHGACWREFDRQWATLAAECETVALLLTHGNFDRTADWPATAVAHLRARTRVTNRLVAVVDAGAAALPDVDLVLTRRAELPQDFVPRVVQMR